ncbi:MAG: hypothetical protein ACE5JE_06450 [Thermoplasmata archaeon]
MAISRWHYVIGGYLIFVGAFYLVALLLGLIPGLDMSRFTVWTVLFWMQPTLVAFGVYYILTVRKKAEQGALASLP